MIGEYLVGQFHESRYGSRVVTGTMPKMRGQYRRWLLLSPKAVCYINNLLAAFIFRGTIVLLHAHETIVQCGSRFATRLHRAEARAPRWKSFAPPLIMRWPLLACAGNLLPASAAREAALYHSPSAGRQLACFRPFIASKPAPSYSASRTLAPPEFLWLQDDASIMKAALPICHFLCQAMPRGTSPQPMKAAQTKHRFSLRIDSHGGRFRGFPRR